ncbi:ubiquitin-related domain-containing protein [Amylostereum chailletii]|nr:ubiquitin-related domain-containing protein [Amylostereum chailletii]
MSQEDDASQDIKPTISEKIQIEVNFEGRPVKFKLKKTNSLRKVLDAASKQLNMEPGTLRFTYNGKRIRPEDDETPDSLGMEDDDVIDAHMAQVGGGWAVSCTCTRVGERHS